LSNKNIEVTNKLYGKVKSEFNMNYYTENAKNGTKKER
jgi:hypothetical protein